MSTKKNDRKKWNKLGKEYLKDYTEFNFKIDSILNEGYTFIKKAQPKVFVPSRITKLEIRDIISE